MVSSTSLSSYKSRHIPQFRSTKIFVESSVPGRQREVIAQREIDHIASRIAEQNRYKDARRLVKIIDSNKVVRAGMGKKGLVVVFS